jgi:hypothetical protein|tara:strand:+ start:641 stop:1030 length:390 start_codon:yes stop_codon:yes gene_type:complete
MAFGIIKADTLTHSTAGSLATNFVVQGVNKAWIQRDFNSDITDSSLNMSTVTDTALGDETMNITSAMNDALYAVTGMASRKGNSTNFHVVMIHDSADPTTTAYRLRCSDVSGNDKDPQFVSTAVKGDLA